MIVRRSDIVNKKEEKNFPFVMNLITRTKEMYRQVKDRKSLL